MRARRAAPRAAQASESPGAGAGFRCRTKIWVERHGAVALSEWRIALLEQVQETGSLSHAAEKMGVPYRTAWYKLKDIEECLGVKLLEAHSGGAEGGYTELTPTAQDLIGRFHRVTAGVSRLVEERFQAEFGDRLG